MSDGLQPPEEISDRDAHHGAMIDESAHGCADVAQADPLRKRALRDILVRWAIDGYYAA